MEKRSMSYCAPPIVGNPGTAVIVVALEPPRVARTTPTTMAAAAPATAILVHLEDQMLFPLTLVSAVMVVTFVMNRTAAPSSFARDAVTCS